MIFGKRGLIVTIIITGIIASAGMLLHVESERILPDNIFLADIPLSGLNREQASPVIQAEINRFNKRSFQVMIEDKLSKNFSAEELGIHYQAEKTLNRIFDDTNWVVKLLRNRWNEKNDKRKTYKPVVSINESKLKQALDEYLMAQERDYRDADIVWEEGEWRVVEAIPGTVLKNGEMERITQFIQEGTFPYQETLSTSAVFENVEARLYASDLSLLLEKTQQIVQEPIHLNYDRDKTELSLLQDPDWLVIDVFEKTAILNETFAKNWIDQYIEEHDRDPGQVVVKDIEELVSEYDGKIIKRAVYEGDFTKGRVSDRDQLLTDLRNLVKDPELKRSITVSWNFINSKVISMVPDYQFPQILSTGVTSYRLGNHPNRIKNIKLSLGTFQGFVAEAGEEISFNRITGWITPRKGYTKTKIISEGRVEEGVGGGVCQTSTTVYRSILNAGFPVTERRNHTLDISYYHAYGYGLDATVYTDARSDLRFVNDFPGPIMVNIYTDDYNQEAHVEFYGTTDHRTVELTNLYTGDYLLKKWEWKIIWPEKEEIRYVTSRYQVPKPEEDEEEINPLEA